MSIDFNNIKEITVPGLNNGTGEMTARMFMNGVKIIIPCKIRKGGSIGIHKHGTPDKPRRDYVFGSTDAAFEFGHGLGYSEIE